MYIHIRCIVYIFLDSVHNGGPKSSQGKQNEPQSHPKETNKSEIYMHINKTHANSRSIAIQRPPSI